MPIGVQAQPVRTLLDISTLPLTVEADGFTELLNRESRAAHKSLIEPTPRSTRPTMRTYSSTEQQTPTSPTASRLKTKRSRTSVEKPRAQKPLRTYGRSSQDIFEFYGSSDRELDGTPTIPLGHKAEKRKKSEKPRVDHAVSRRGSQDEDVTRRAITSSGGDTELLSTWPKPHEISSAAEKEASLRSSMPPPASKSTSFEHSQRSQTDTITTVADPAAGKSFTSNLLPPAVASYSKIYSADRISASRRPSCGGLDEGRSQDLAQNVKLQSIRSNEATRRIDPIGESASSSRASEISSSKSTTVSRANQAENVSEELSSHVDVGRLGSPLDSGTLTTVNPVSLLLASTDTEGAQDELSNSMPEAASKSVTKPMKTSKRKRDTDDETLDEHGSDDNALGVPKEHYQPRPSKRRSGGGDREIVIPTDFSKRPEAMGKGKRKTKRHKTTAFQELLPKDEDEDEEVKVVPDPRFEIPEKKTQKISTENDQPDAESKDNTENIRPEAEPEPNQTAKSTGQKKRGRPKKVVTNLSEERVLDEPEADYDHDGAETEEHVKQSQKKAKTRENPMPIIDEQDSDTTGAPAAQDDAPAPSTNILNETNGNVIPPKPTTESPPKTSPAKPILPPETPHKSTTPAPKGPDKHSPISSGKVAYRVGLSKRARIAPLLRIVRK